MKSFKFNRNTLIGVVSFALAIPAVAQMSGSSDMAGSYSSSMGSMGTDIRDAGSRDRTESRGEQSAMPGVDRSKPGRGLDGRASYRPGRNDGSLSTGKSKKTDSSEELYIRQ
jgi:hypothetical protein